MTANDETRATAQRTGDLGYLPIFASHGLTPVLDRLLNAARAEATTTQAQALATALHDLSAAEDALVSQTALVRAQARRIGELEAEVARLQDGAKAFAAQVVEDVTQRAADVVLAQTKRIAALKAALGEFPCECDPSWSAYTCRACKARALLSPPPQDKEGAG